METFVAGNWRPEYTLLARVRDWSGPVLVWAIWGAATIAMFFFIRRHARNIPIYDDFGLVSVMTGHEPVSLRWLWCQHNEHRVFIPRLILVGLWRFLGNDFCAGMYFNAGLLSAAASMLLLARRLRGSTSVTEAVLPLSILSLGQAEVLLINIALSLVLTAWISFELISSAGLAGRRPGWRLVLVFGLFLVLLPLCGGSGLFMGAPLALWLTGYVAWGWWSEREPGGMMQAIGLGLLMACSALVALSLSGYVRPLEHPLGSTAAAASTMLECLSLAVFPVPVPPITRYWRFAGPISAFLVATTLLRLVIVGLRAPSERHRALALIAIILSFSVLPPRWACHAPAWARTVAFLLRFTVGWPTQR